MESDARAYVGWSIAVHYTAVLRDDPLVRMVRQAPQRHCSGDPESLANILANHHEGPILFLPGSDQEDTHLASFTCGIRKKFRTLEYQADGLSLKSRLYVDAARSGKRAGILVFPEATGLGGHACERAEQLARLRGGQSRI